MKKIVLAAAVTCISLQANAVSDHDLLLLVIGSQCEDQAESIMRHREVNVIESITDKERNELQNKFTDNARKTTIEKYPGDEVAKISFRVLNNFVPDMISEVFDSGEAPIIRQWHNNNPDKKVDDAALAEIDKKFITGVATFRNVWGTRCESFAYKTTSVSE